MGKAKDNMLHHEMWNFFGSAADTRKRGWKAGWNDATIGMVGFLAGQPDAPYLRSYARALRDAADRADRTAAWLEEREAERCACHDGRTCDVSHDPATCSCEQCTSAERAATLPWGQGPHLIDPNHPSMRRTD